MPMNGPDDHYIDHVRRSREVGTDWLSPAMGYVIAGIVVVLALAVAIPLWWAILRASLRACGA